MGDKEQVSNAEGVAGKGRGRGGRLNRLANSSSNLSFMKPYSMSSRALKTSGGMIVFLLEARVFSFALQGGC